MNRGRTKFEKFLPCINIWVRFYSIFPQKVQVKLLERSRYSRGYIGQVKRYALVKNMALSVGNNVSIKEGVYLYNIGQLSIGNNVSIWPMTYIDAYGGVEIGDDVSIAHSCSILSFDHTFDEQDIPIKYQPVRKLPVKIEKDVWLGAKVVVLGGTTVRSGCVIGAGSVVTKNTEEKSVYVGVPAKKIKERLFQ